MAFTLSSSVTEVRSLINEPTASYWSDTEIESWIKQGCLDWCEKTLLLTQEDVITLATDTYRYTASTGNYINNAIRTLHAEHKGIALKRLTYEEMRGHTQMALATDEDPRYIYDKYNGLVFTVWIGDTPSVEQNGDSINVIFALRTDAIAELPYEHQSTIFNYAAAKAKMKERQWQEAQLLWQMYLNNVAFARKDKLEIPEQSFDQFKER